MRDRIRTPFFFVPWGHCSTERGDDTPPQPVPGRSLVGQIVGGRFLLRAKTGHSPESVQFAAIDMLGGIDVDLEIYPDGTLAAGYRLGLPRAEHNPRDLPNLYGLDFSAESATPPIRPKPSLWLRFWRLLTGRS